MSSVKTIKLRPNVSLELVFVEDHDKSSTNLQKVIDTVGEVLGDFDYAIIIDPLLENFPIEIPDESVPLLVGSAITAHLEKKETLNQEVNEKEEEKEVPLKKFFVTFTDTLSRTIVIEARSSAEAYEIAENHPLNREGLDYEIDFLGSDIEIEEDQDQV